MEKEIRRIRFKNLILCISLFFEYFYACDVFKTRIDFSIFPFIAITYTFVDINAQYIHIPSKDYSTSIQPKFIELNWIIYARSPFRNPNDKSNSFRIDSKKDRF